MRGVDLSMVFYPFTSHTCFLGFTEFALPWYQHVINQNRNDNELENIENSNKNLDIKRE